MKRPSTVRSNSPSCGVFRRGPALRLAIGVVLTAFGVLLCGSPAPAEENAEVVRLAAVNTPYYTGLLGALLADFKETGGPEVWIYSGKDIYEQARAGKADIVISHYGKEGVESFVLDGHGMWPRTLFANQSALIGPKSDPAKIRGLKDAAEAFRRIAATGSPYINNNREGSRYLTKLLWEAAGKPDKGDWFIETRAENVSAVMLAQEKSGYVLYGAFPFLRYKEAAQIPMEALVLDDPILQRVMVSIVVNPEKVPGVNYSGAQALEDYLLSPRAQAIVRAFRVPGCDAQLWWPAGRSNDPKILPK